LDTMEQKLESILSNPQMMQQIMALAQSMGSVSASQTEASPVHQDNVNQNQAAPDPGMSKLLSSLAGGTGIDQEQKQLLQALSPYLSRERVNKLENAMRAAKMARMASAFLENGGLQMIRGR